MTPEVKKARRRIKWQQIKADPLRLAKARASSRAAAARRRADPAGNAARNAAIALRYATDPDFRARVKARHRAWYASRSPMDREARNARRSSAREANRERANLESRLYRLANLEKIRGVGRRYSRKRTIKTITTKFAAATAALQRL